MAITSAPLQPREHRLHVVTVEDPHPRRILSSRLPGELVSELFVCGRCSIIFAAAEAHTIHSGAPAVCVNCGAWNQL